MNLQLSSDVPPCSRFHALVKRVKFVVVEEDAGLILGW